MAEVSPAEADQAATEVIVGRCGHICNPDSENPYVEAVVCQESDLKEDEMTMQNIPDDGEILVVRQKGKIYAIGNRCSHFGAQLHTGALGNGRVRCPWHGACFNLATGDIEDFPGLDSLPCLEVNVQDDGGVNVRGFKKHLMDGVRTRCKITVKRDLEDKRTFVVVGGGPAGQVCAETLREDGFQGEIIMLVKEEYLPYDRTMITKCLSVKPEDIVLRSNKFYKKYDIDLKLGAELRSINTSEKTLEISTGLSFKYDSVFLATGSRARRIRVPGSNLENVFKLRSIEDAQKIDKEITEDKNLIIIGDSFIGMECASSCIGRVKNLSVIGLKSVPLALVLGLQIGGQIKKLFEERGVNFFMNSNVVEISPKESDSSYVGQVKLEGGEVLEADVVILGVGCTPYTVYLEGSDVKTENGFITVNEYLESSVPGVFAGGDIALAPVLGKVASIGHWQLALYHGRIAGRNMLGKKQPLNATPFFWTRLLEKGIRYSGYAPGFDDIVIHGNVEEMNYIAFYCKEDSVLAVSTCENDPIASYFSELLAVGKRLSKTEVEESPTAWIKKIRD